MKKCYQIMFLILLIGTNVKSQSKLYVYHGTRGESKVYENKTNIVSNPKIKLKQGDKFTVEVSNYNPILYNYSLKSENINFEGEDKAIIDLVQVFGKIITAKMSAKGFTASSDLDEYKKEIDSLFKEIQYVNKLIKKSDFPESFNEADEKNQNVGYRAILKKVMELPDIKYRFNDTNLLTNLNAISDKASKDEIEKQAFKLLNNSIVEIVNSLKKETSQASTPSIWKKEIVVRDTAQKITLIISKKGKNLIRDGFDKDYELEIATIYPYYKRAVLELIPVANFIYTKDAKEFYLENNLVNFRTKNNFIANAGLILNINALRFGEYKEMSLGFGPGFKFNSSNEILENFYFSTLVSYKEFMRIGLGIGFSQTPSEILKDGIQVGQALPSSISNLNDIIQYENKPSAFISISFTGLNLSNKK